MKTSSRTFSQNLRSAFVGVGVALAAAPMASNAQTVPNPASPPEDPALTQRWLQFNQDKWGENPAVSGNLANYAVRYSDRATQVTTQPNGAVKIVTDFKDTTNGQTVRIVLGRLKLGGHQPFEQLIDDAVGQLANAPKYKFGDLSVEDKRRFGAALVSAQLEDTYFGHEKFVGLPSNMPLGIEADRIYDSAVDGLRDNFKKPRVIPGSHGLFSCMIAPQGITAKVTPTGGSSTVIDGNSKTEVNYSIVNNHVTMKSVTSVIGCNAVTMMSDGKEVDARGELSVASTIDRGGAGVGFNSLMFDAYQQIHNQRPSLTRETASDLAPALTYTQLVQIGKATAAQIGALNKVAPGSIGTAPDGSPRCNIPTGVYGQFCTLLTRPTGITGVPDEPQRFQASLNRYFEVPKQ